MGFVWADNWFGKVDTGHFLAVGTVANHLAHSRTLSDSDPSAVSQPIRAISGGVRRGPQPAPDRLGAAPHEPNRGRALEQLALIRQRREGVAAGN